MSNRSSDTAASGRADAVRVADIAKYLANSANLHKQAKVGSAAFADDLRRFAQGLKPLARLSVDEFAEAVNAAAPAKRRAFSAKVMVDLPPDLQSLPAQEVEEIVADKRYTRAQLAELGAARFGLSRSELSHGSKAETCRAIRAALRNEHTLKVIGQEARRCGRLRA